MFFIPRVLNVFHFLLDRFLATIGRTLYFLSTIRFILGKSEAAGYEQHRQKEYQSEIMKRYFLKLDFNWLSTQWIITYSVMFILQ